MVGAEVLRGEKLRDRIVSVASDLFNAHGIRAVSADRILAVVGCSKVSFYRHFASKDDLVTAALEDELAYVATVVGERGDQDFEVMLRQQLCRPGFRGCPFINAAAEYPDPDHPVRHTVAKFRRLMIETFEGALSARGVANPREAAHALMMLRDGALVSGYLESDPEAVISNFAFAMRAVTKASGSTVA